MKINAYDNTGKVVIYHKDKRYVYYGLSPIHRRYVENMIKRGLIGAAFNYLRSFSRADLVAVSKPLEKRRVLGCEKIGQAEIGSVDNPQSTFW
jgi:hypothetical protein